MADALLADEPDQAHVLRRAWPYLRPHRAGLIAALTVNLLSAAAFALVPAVIGRAVDDILERDRAGLLWSAAAVIALVVARMLLLRQSELLLNRVGERIVRDLRDLAVHRLSRAPLRFLEQHRTGDLLHRTTTEIAELAAFVRSQLPDLLAVIGYLGFTAVLLLSYSWPLSLLVLVVFLPPMIALTAAFRRAAGRAFPAHAQAEADLAATFQESLDAREQLQLAGATGEWLTRMTGRADVVQHAVRRVQGAITWIDGTWVVQALTNGALLVVGGMLVADGQVTVGVVVTFVLAGRELFSSFDDLAFVIGEVVESKVGLARLLDLLDATRQPDGAGTRIEIPAAPAVGAELRAEGIRFGYQPGVDVLHGVDVVFAPGQRTGLVGRTGSGKTTLAKLLSGLYAPDAGRVRLGGVDLADLPQPELRRRVVLIPQQVHLITGTLRENLALTPGAPGPAEIDRAVQRLQLVDWVASLGEGTASGLDTHLGPRGATLSAGERQLVALLRTAMVDPDVLLLDEATADLDPVTAARIEIALDRLHVDRTLIVIAHRPTTIERLPRVVRLDAGRLVTGPSLETAPLAKEEH